MGRSVWQRNVTRDEQLISLHHIRWRANRTARRVVLAVVVVSLADSRDGCSRGRQVRSERDQPITLATRRIG